MWREGFDSTSLGLNGGSFHIPEVSHKRTKRHRWNRPPRSDSRSLNVFNLLRMTSRCRVFLRISKTRRGPWSSTSNLPATFDRQDMEKEVAAEKEDQQLDCTSAREQPLVSLGDCTDLQSGTELFFDCKSTFWARWLVFTKVWECNHWVHLLRYQIRSASSSILFAPACIGRQKWFMIDPYKHL